MHAQRMTSSQITHALSRFYPFDKVIIPSLSLSLVVAIKFDQKINRLEGFMEQALANACVRAFLHFEI